VRHLERAYDVYKSFILLVTLYDALQLVCIIDSTLSGPSVALLNRIYSSAVRALFSHVTRVSHEERLLLHIPGAKLAVGWKQQPVIRGPLGLQPFVCCLLVNLPLFLSI
jgi:hypothetical protein